MRSELTFEAATHCNNLQHTTNTLQKHILYYRLVRVLRIGKLVSMFPQIQRQLKVIQKTLSTVSSLIALITLFLLIFAILGMNLFGNRAICELDSEDVGAHQTVFGSVSQCVAVCCSVLQCVVVCCRVFVLRSTKSTGRT